MNLPNRAARGASTPSKKGLPLSSGRKAYERPGRIKLNSWTDQDWENDLRECMRIYGKCGASDFYKTKSDKTKANRWQTIRSVMRLLRSRVRNFKTLSQLKPSQLPVILAAWNEEGGHCGQTQVQEISVLRWFWRLHGIRINEIKQYVEDPEILARLKRVSVATQDKSWEGNGVDVIAIIERAEEIDPVAARLIYLSCTFGLRMNESLQLRPHEAAKADHLHITRGAKGGRERKISYGELDDQSLQQAIEWAKHQLSVDQHAAWEQRTLKQARRHLYFVLNKLGITKSGLGVTFHGLRTQFIITQFKRLTGGLDAPIRGGAHIDYQQLTGVRRTLAEAIGHNRISVTSAYLGSFFRMTSAAEMRFQDSWRRLEPLLDFLKTVLVEHHVDNIWFVGRRSCGANNTLAEDFEFLLDDKVPLKIAGSVAQAIVRAVETQLGSVLVHHGITASSEKRRLWAAGALPLFDVDAPQLTGLVTTWGV